MFGFGDMAMGSDMEMNGAMDMADGMMLAQMGMPGLGAMEMGIGAMEMGMGQDMMAMGMMENMYGGYGMGGMMAMDTALMVGCMGLGCTLACCNPGLYRRGCIGMGCNLPCCFPGRRFGNCIGIGCIGPCCATTTTEVIIVNGNSNQYQSPQQQYRNQGQQQYQNGYQNQQYQNRPQQTQYQNQQYQQNPPQYHNQQYQQNPPQYHNQQYQQNPPQYQNQQYQQNPPQQYRNPPQQYQNPTQQYQNQSNYRQNQPNISPNQQQPNYKSTPQQINNYQPNQPQKIQSQVSDQVLQQKFKEEAKKINPETSGYPEVPEYNKIGYQSQQKFNINNSFATESLQEYKEEVFFQGQQQQYIQNSSNYVNPNVIYQGHLLKRHGFNWTQNPSAILTKTHLIEQPLNYMTKLKITMDVTHQNSCFMKVTMNNVEDHFYGCYKNQQSQWFCSIIWAKMAAMGKMSDRFAPFTGFIEGSILRKSQFLGNWEFRHVKIDGSGLKSYQNVNSLPTLNLCAIKELWTRFEYMNGGNYLVIKCKCNGTKYEYGVPVQYAFPWIKAFYSLLV